ncbi:transcription termination factor 2 isoform X2 [Sphaerodactylus townsendi]|uniref:transcription termination factor 2 isoform X2 n=1 Tax=Sphaerodactylus townsendi TaxID=933632 RepID=UPI00202761A6|nr:transcription termination factor 2 isoform X2 [Sphaerodactylus townsendi]
MEKVLCPPHGVPCLLKTGIKDGPNKGKSFYVCGVQNQPPCEFVFPTKLCPSHCLIHEECVVELQVLVQQQETDQYRLFYRCTKCKMEGKQWCGSVPWQDSQPTKLSSKPQSQHTLDLSLNRGDQRNPFKVLDKNQERFCLKQINNDGDKNSPKKDNRETLGYDKKFQQKLSTESVGKELLKDCKIELGNKSGRSSKGEKQTQMSSSDLTAGLQETALLHIPKSCSGTKAEIPSGYIRGSSVMRPAKDGLQKQERSCCSQAPSIKPLNEDQLGKGGSETCIDKRVTVKMHGNGGHEKRTVTPGGLVITEEHTGLPTVSTRENPLLPREITPEEKQGTNKNVTGDEQHRFLPSKSPVELTVDSLHGKDWCKKNSPSLSQGSASSQRAEIVDSKALHGQLSAQLRQKTNTLKMVNVRALPDKGARLLKQVQELEAALSSLNLEIQEDAKQGDAGIVRKKEELLHNPFRRTTTEPPSILKGKGPQMFHEHKDTRQLELSLPAGSNQHCSNPSGEYSSVQTFYGGRMTEDRLRAVYNATSDAINQLHKSLKSCPAEEAVAVDPPGLKVSLLLHQKQALAWLLWREIQVPCGGILADDMGLGKTLTMIALVLSQGQLQKEKRQEKKLEICISRQDSSVTFSNGTLIVCPASLIHHWKKEVERHVNNGKLRICLYHGHNRNKNTTVLSGYDIVITTYSILGKEIPTRNEEAEVAAKDHVSQDKPFSPLLWINWARIILDEAHNIRNPKVQASIAACKLRASARWAVTGTPIQNNLLDMYSLLRFLHCSPFDEFKVWKSQVDNNTRKGGERLAILTRSLLLRRTKDQLDSSGKPLVSLPQRLTRLHRLKLSGAEQSVYDVLFTRSRSTLQSYLKRQETQATGSSGENPFERAHQFQAGQQDSMGKTKIDTPSVSTTVHILSMLLRLRQCCCHLSLLKVALEKASLDSEGISLSLEEQLSAMTLSESDSSDPQSVVYLFGSPFGVDLFEITRQSTKLSHLLEELKAIQRQSQKSVVVSQWTSMLKIVAVHLEKLGLKYATVDGSVSPKQRMDLVEEFNNNPKGSQVMLISLLAGGVGLNLIGGNHLFLLDMHWNPALEDQACDRIYRVGQQKDVVIHRFVCEGTVEEKISGLQGTKKELAQKVLSGRGDSFTKLTLADLKLLFSI